MVKLYLVVRVCMDAVSMEGLGVAIAVLGLVLTASLYLDQVRINIGIATYSLGLFFEGKTTVLEASL